MKNVYFVLGPGRSGTSTITKALSALGINLGDNLMAPKSGVNDKGFFEDLDVHALNTRLFEDNNLAWHTFKMINKSDFITSAFAQEAKDILKDKFKSSYLIGIKEPQITRLLPFWISAASQVGATDYHIIATRNPTSVARSLAKHTGFGLAKCYELWFIFTLRSLSDSPIGRRIVVSYEKMIEDPVGELNRISSRFNLEFDARSPQVLRFANSFVDKDLQHNKVASKVEERDIPMKTAALHNLMERLSTDENDPDEAKLIEEIQYFSEIRRRETGPTSLIIEQALAIDDLKALVEVLRESVLGVVAERDFHKEQLEILGREANSLVDRVADYETAVKLLQETVENLIVDRDAYKEKVKILGREANCFVDRVADYETAVKLLQETVENLIVDRDAYKSALKKEPSKR